MILRIIAYLLLACSAQQAQDKLFLKGDPAYHGKSMDLEYESLYREMLTNADDFNSKTLPITINSFQNMIVLYQRFLSSRSDGARCQFTPSCSRYTYMSIANYGAGIGIIRGLDRIWRCNSSAIGLYASYGQYLFDPPYEMWNTLSSATEKQPTNPGDSTYLTWLIKHREWENAYREALRLEYAQPSIKNRLTLSGISLNNGDPKKAEVWLSGDTMRDASFLRSLALFRQGLYGSTISVMKSGISNQVEMTPAEAVLLLSASLKMSVTDSDRLNQSIDVIQRQFGSRSFIEMYQAIQSRSVAPGISLACSAIIPGLGQTIHGFTEDGVYAFTIVGLFAYLATKNIIANQVGESIAFALAFTLTYSANLFAAHKAPQRRYDRSVDKLLIELYKVYDPFSPVSVY